jgi:F-type H+-transporting ATPase subunit alpha
VDDVAVDRVKEFQTKIMEYLSLRKAELLQTIAREKKLTEAMESELKAAADAFKNTWK